MIKIMITLVTLLVATLTYAQNEPVTNDKPSFPESQWVSKNSNDFVTIQNGSGLPLVILINVDKNSSSVTVKNCGTVAKIEAGSSAVCTTSDANDPVTLSSDSTTIPAAGTYQVKQQ